MTPFPAPAAEPEASRTRRLRVLVMSHMYPRDAADSAGIFVREQVEALAESADVTVVVGRYDLDSPRTVAADGFEVAEVPLPWSDVLPSAFNVARAVPEYYRRTLELVRARKERFDIVHAHFAMPDGLAGTMLGRALGVPVVVTLHGTDFHRQLSRPIAGGLVGSRLASGAAVVIGVSDAIAEGMRSRFRMPADRAIHMANGYNDREITVHAVRDPKYFLFVGALIPRKNPDVLLDAYASVAERIGLDLVLVGSGPMEDELRASAERHGIFERVRFEGQREHRLLDAYLAEAAALVLPSSSEGMPIVVNEALASGTPVVASRLPGTEQQVRSDAFGRLVPARDVSALASALVQVAEETWDYAYIAENNGVPSWSRYARQLLDVYSRVLDAREGSHAEGAAG